MKITAVEAVALTAPLPEPWRIAGASGALCVIASLHLAAASPNFTIFEHMVIPNPLREGLVKEGLPPVRDGMIPVPEGPGLGVTVDEEQVARFESRSYG